MATTVKTTTRRQSRQTSAPARLALGGKVIDPVRLLRQNTWLIAGSCVVGVGVGVVAYVISLLFFPSYRGQVVFELAPDLQAADDVISADRRSADIVTRLAKTEVNRVLSPTVLASALENRDIAQTKWVEQFRDQGVIDLNEALIVLTDELAASHPRDTNTFLISWSGRIANDVPIILNAVEDSYLNALQDLNDVRFNSNLKTFTDQRDELDSTITFLETEKQNFVRENNITSLNEAVNERRARAEALTDQISDARRVVELLGSKLQQVSAKLEGRMEASEDDIRIAELNPIIMNLKARIRDLRVNLGAARERFHDGHLSVRAMERELKSAEYEKNLAIEELVHRDLTAQFKESSDERASFERLLTALEADFDETSTSLRDYASALGALDSINRRVDAVRTDRDDLNRTIADIRQVRVRADSAKVTVMQKALKPKVLNFPDAKLVIPAGLVLVVSLALGFVFLRELIDNRIRYPNDIPSIAGARLLGVIPDIAEDPTGIQQVELAVRDEPDSVIAETFRQTASQVYKSLSAKGHHSVLLMSGMPEAGTTAIATNLAASLRATGRTVAVLDGNFRRPRLESAFGLETAAKGLGDVLAGDVPVESVMQSTADGIEILGAGSEQNRVFERLNTSAMDDALSALTRRFDVVIVDGPPGVVSGDALVLASKTDATAIIVRAGSEERGLVGRLVSQLHQMEVEFLGIIFNRPRNTAGGYFKKNFKTMAGYAPRG